MKYKEFTRVKESWIELTRIGERCKELKGTTRVDEK